MPFGSKRVRAIMRWLTWTLGIGTAFIMVYAFAEYDDPSNLAGRLLPPHMRRQVPWKTIFATDLEKGVALPAHTNVIMHLPIDSERITRKVLFGGRGQDVRYWGYCFPENYAQTVKLKRGSLPGKVFMSEGERFYRDQQQRLARRERFSIFRHLRDEYLNEDYKIQRGRLRHQIDYFDPGVSCYVMTEEALPVGTDRDNDGLNTALERDEQSNPRLPDTDADGLMDGLEVLRLGTNPLIRDSDGDGLLDGIEDANQNGKTDVSETDPTEWDTDHDGLCDGLCTVNFQQSRAATAMAPISFKRPKSLQELRGEDKNLDGILDENETDPRKYDTDKDGINDLQEYFNCLIDSDKPEDC